MLATSFTLEPSSLHVWGKIQGSLPGDYILSICLSVCLSVCQSVCLSVSVALYQPSYRYGRITITRSPIVAVVYLTLAIGLESTQQSRSAILTKANNFNKKWHALSIHEQQATWFLLNFFLAVRSPVKTCVISMRAHTSRTKRTVQRWTVWVKCVEWVDCRQIRIIRIYPVTWIRDGGLLFLLCFTLELYILLLWSSCNCWLGGTLRKRLAGSECFLFT